MDHQDLERRSDESGVIVGRACAREILRAQHIVAEDHSQVVITKPVLVTRWNADSQCVETTYRIATKFCDAGPRTLMITQAAQLTIFATSLAG